MTPKLSNLTPALVRDVLARLPSMPPIEEPGSPKHHALPARYTGPQDPQRPMYPKTYRIVGYTYDGDTHCPRCAEIRFGTALADELNPPLDTEGNPVHPIFLGDLSDTAEFCGDCLAQIE